MWLSTLQGDPGPTGPKGESGVKGEPVSFSLCWEKWGATLCERRQ